MQQNLSELKLQNIILSCVKSDTENMLVHGGCIDNNSVYFSNTISFDTYFNIFPIGKFLSYTSIQKIKLYLTLDGNVKVEFHLKTSKDDIVLKTENISFEKKDTAELSIDLTDENSKHDICEASYFYFTISALNETANFFGGKWSGFFKYVRDTNVALCICTYKREEYVCKNISTLCEAISKERIHGIEIFIADNGNSFDKTKIHMPDTHEHQDQVHIFPNKNFGGSGGFARCMIEVCNAKKFNYVLVTDDDIVLEPECVFRTKAFLSCLKNSEKNVCIAGTMFTLEEPSITVESGARWRGKLRRIGSFIDVGKTDELFSANNTKGADYGAWWFFAMPTDTIRNGGLPLPFFVRGDDIEFSLRMTNNDIVSLPGICVWHEYFEKKQNNITVYYVVRNEFVVASLHSDYCSLRKKIFFELLSFLASLLRQRYADVFFRQKAIDDFCIGVDFFKNQNEEELHKSLLAKNREYLLDNKKWLDEHSDEIKKIVFPKETEEEHRDAIMAVGIKKGEALRVLAEYFLPRKFPKKLALINIGNRNLKEYIGYEETIQFNPFNGEIVHSRASKRVFWKLFFAYFLKSAHVFIHANKYKKNYIDGFSEITSEKWWRKHLEIDV